MWGDILMLRLEVQSDLKRRKKIRYRCEKKPKVVLRVTHSAFTEHAKLLITYIYFKISLVKLSFTCLFLADINTVVISLYPAL